MKRDCIIFDLEETICDWKNGNLEEVPNEPIHIIYEALYSTYKDHIDLFLISRRSEDYRSEIEEWLNDHGFYYNELFMRDNNDRRNEYLIKADIVDEIKKTHEIVAAFDNIRSSFRVWSTNDVFAFSVKSDNK